MNKEEEIERSVVYQNMIRELIFDVIQMNGEPVAALTGALGACSEVEGMITRMLYAEDQKDFIFSVATKQREEAYERMSTAIRLGMSNPLIRKVERAKKGLG